MAKKIWQWNNFRGGLSDNSSIGPEGSFQNGSYCVDVETEPNGFKLTSGTTNFSTTGSPNLQFTFGGNHYVFCADKSIYLNGTLKYAFNSTPSTTMGVIYGVDAITISGTTFLLLFGNTEVHKVSLDLNTISYTFATIAQSALRKYTIRYGDLVYFTNKNLFCSIDSAGTVTTLFTANIDNVFVGLTFFQDTFKVYSSYDNGSSGKCFMLPISSLSSPSYIVNFENLCIRGVTNNRGNDFLIAGYSNSASDLFVMNGTTLQSVKSNMEGNTRLRGFNGIIATRFDDIYLGGNPDTNTYGMFKYGKQYTGFSDILTQVTTHAGNIVSIVCSSAFIYIGTADNNVYKYDCQSPSTLYYAPAGELQSLITDLGDPFTYKSIVQIDIPYDCDNSYLPVPHGGTITLYARKDGSDSWTTFYTGTPASGIGNIRILSNQLSSLGFGDFYQIEFKFKIEPKTLTGNNFYTPLVKGLKLIYEDNVKE